MATANLRHKLSVLIIFLKAAQWHYNIAKKEKTKQYKENKKTFLE